MLDLVKINSLMKRAMQLAETARGKVSPNPLVGACVVNDKGEVLGEGLHEKFGGPHAEINAIKNAKANGVRYFKDLTLISTLEPCNIQGKTPPCTVAITKAGFKAVIIGIMDPNPLINKKGAAILKKSGIEVITGFLANELAAQNAGFISCIKRGRPHVTLKLALSPDGLLSTDNATRTKITTPAQDKRVHELRGEQDAILIGIGTVRSDDPLLNVRSGSFEGKKLLRVILDPQCSISLQSALVKTARSIPTLLVISNNLTPDARSSFKTSFSSGGPDAPSLEDKIKSLLAKGIRIREATCISGRIDLKELLKFLVSQDVGYLLVEGGEKVASSFLRDDLVDDAMLFYGSKLFGTPSGGALDHSMANWPFLEQIQDHQIDEKFALQHKTFLLKRKTKFFADLRRARELGK